MRERAPSTDVAEAKAFLHEGRFAEALASCRRALQRDPTDLDAEHVVARILIARGQVPFAVMALERLTTRRPDDAELHTSLGFALRLAGDAPRARSALHRAIEVDPAEVKAHVELAYVDLLDGDLDAAIARLECAVEGPTSSGDAYFALAGALVHAGRTADARTAFSRAIELDPKLADRHIQLVYWYRSLKDEANALAMLDEGVALQPEHPELVHLRDAAHGDSTGDRVADEYLVHYFDQFSDRFDDWLVNRLDYHVPEALTGLVQQRVGDRARDLDVLDAGCGTGLMGPMLRPIARRLVGVDISPGMLSRARDRGYDELVEQELLRYLDERKAKFDLIVAADVLIYFGDLAALLTGFKAALNPDGAVGFSVERADEDRVLRQSGRWAHSERFVREAAAAAGLDVTLEPATLRLEHNEPVAGYLVIGGHAP